MCGGQTCASGDLCCESCPPNPSFFCGSECASYPCGYPIVTIVDGGQDTSPADANGGSG
jgi:hypothetical protein